MKNWNHEKPIRIITRTGFSHLKLKFYVKISVALGRNIFATERGE